MRYKCTVCYDGSQFHGFQTQSDLRTVQIEIEAALEIIHKRKVNIFACSRTDAGVHAYGQIFHFDSEIKMPEWNMQNAINSRLPNDIYIKKVEIVSEDFHARYQVSKKEYHYLIDVGEYDPLKRNYRYYPKYHKTNIEAMEAASKVFIGVHDFKSYTKNHEIKNTVREIYDIEFIREGSLVTIKFIGNGFLHNMIRIIVAMLLEVGWGNLSKDDLEYILKQKNRKLAPKLAPANGLYLYKIYYNEKN